MGPTPHLRATPEQHVRCGRRVHRPLNATSEIRVGNAQRSMHGPGMLAGALTTTDRWRPRDARRAAVATRTRGDLPRIDRDLEVILASIARRTGRHPTTLAREVEGHRGRAKYPPAVANHWNWPNSLTVRAEGLLQAIMAGREHLRSDASHQ